MLFDGAQHVGETAEHMRADRLALEGAGGGATDVALGDRNAEVIRPEGRQAFNEADRRRTGLFETGLRIGAKILLIGAFVVHRRAGRRHVRGRRGLQGRDIGRRHAERGDAHRLKSVALLLASPLVFEDRLENRRAVWQIVAGQSAAHRRGPFVEQSGARVASG